MKRSTTWGARLAGLVLVLTAVPAQAFEYDPSDVAQDSFVYCFTAAMSSTAKRQRFRDAVAISWGHRAIVNAVEHPCTDSGALTVDYRNIDNQYGTYAEVIFNGAGSAVRANFDLSETWYDGTGQGNCYTLDFWGVAAHEVGHIWGLNHSFIIAPEGGVPTMGYHTGYACPEQYRWSRSLQSDDEAGILYIKTRHYMPNPSFERYYDCVPGVCSGSGEWAFYWNFSGNWTRYRDTFPALDGEYYMRVLGQGSIWQRVNRRTCNGFQTGCQSVLSFGLNNRTASPASVRVIVRDISGGTTRVNTTCTGVPLTWTTCSITFLPQTILYNRLYEFEIKNETSAEFWVDLVRVIDLAN